VFNSLIIRTYTINGYHNIVYEINNARRIAFRFERLAAGHLRVVFDFWKNCITNSRHVIDLILTRVIRHPSYTRIFVFLDVSFSISLLARTPHTQTTSHDYKSVTADTKRSRNCIRKEVKALNFTFPTRWYDI